MPKSVLFDCFYKGKLVIDVLICDRRPIQIVSSAHSLRIMSLVRIYCSGCGELDCSSSLGIIWASSEVSGSKMAAGPEAGPYFRSESSKCGLE